MFLLWALLALARSAEYKAKVAADGHVEYAGYVRRESRAQDGGLVHSVPVSKVAVSAAEAVSNVTVRPTGDQLTVWKEEAKEASTALSLSLLASIGFILTVFYMASSSNELQAAVWKILARGISLFATVLLFMVLKKTWKIFMGSSETEQIFSDVFSSLRFLALLFAVPFLFKKQMEHERRKQCISIAGVHLIGFAGADAFTDILKQQVFSSNCWMYLLGVAGFTLLLALIHLGASKWRASEPDVSTPLEEMEVDTTAFIVGFLLSMWTRFAVSGAVPGARYGRKVTGDDVSWLFISTMVAFALAAASVYIPEQTDRPVLQRVMRTFSSVLWMTFSWLAFYLVQWVLWSMAAGGAHGKLVAANGLAIAGSALVFFPMTCGHFMGRSGWMVLKIFLSFASLVLAFSWETAVYMAVEGAAETVEGDVLQKLLAMIYIIVILGAILPAWYIYMLPREAKSAAPETPA